MTTTTPRKGRPPKVGGRAVSTLVCLPPGLRAEALKLRQSGESISALLARLISLAVEEATNGRR